MALKEEQKRKIQAESSRVITAIGNIEAYVIQKDDPIVDGKRASFHIAKKLRVLVGLLEDCYKAPRT